MTMRRAVCKETAMMWQLAEWQMEDSKPYDICR